MLTTVMGTIKSVDTLFGILSGSNKDNLLGNLEDSKKRGVIYSRGSIPELLSKFVIEPTILVSNSLQRSESIDDVIKLNLDTFTAFYTQAFNVLTQIHGLESSTTFDLLSSTYAEGTLGFSSESVDKVILNDEEVNKFLTLDADMASYGGYPRKNKSKSDTKSSKDSKDSNSNSSRHASAEANKDDVVKTMVRTIKVNITATNDKGVTAKVSMDVIVKANVIFTPFEDITRLVSMSDESKQFGARWDEYRSGAITLKDLFLASDLIEEAKKAKLRDNKDLIRNMDERSRASLSKLGTSGALGFGKYYQLIVVNANEKISLERRLSGKIEKTKYKNKLLEQVNSMAITVVDEDYERVSMYVKDLSGYSDISLKSLKKSKGTDDLSDVLKNMLASRMIYFN